jgi:flagellar motor switch protein FliG
MADDKNPLNRANWTPKLRAEMEAMTSTQRAAVLMLLLGEDQAANIIKYLNPKEVQALGAAMVAAADLSQEAVNVVLDEFVEMLKNQTSLSLGNSDYVEKVMRRALGDDKANSVLNRIMPGQGTKGLDILSWMDARGIADMIRTEHPQVIAIILSLLDGVVAAEVLIFLPAEIRPEVIQRVATLDTVQPAAMAELESIMKQQFSKSASQQSSSFGGVMAAAKIMNLTKTELESSIMQGLGDIDPDLMMKIQDQMFTFDNLASVDNKGVQVLMRAVEPDLLMTALKGASEEVANRFYDNMSERARGMFKDDMEAKGPVRLSDVEEAQKKIMRQARKLSDSGELMLGGADFV